jgi:hypothetical protein
MPTRVFLKGHFARYDGPDASRSDYVELARQVPALGALPRPHLHAPPAIGVTTQSVIAKILQDGSLQYEGGSCRHLRSTSLHMLSTAYERRSLSSARSLWLGLAELARRRWRQTLGLSHWFAQ